jgi:hypothetical protein
VTLPRPFLRVLAVLVVLLGGAVAAVGGLALRAPGVVAVGVAGLLAGLTAAAIARDTPGHSLRATVEAAVLAAAGTVAALLVVSGTAALAGGWGIVALLTAGAGGWVLRTWTQHRGRGARPGVAGDAVHLAVVGDPADVDPRPDAAGGAVPTSPVSGLSTADLGREWLRTTAVLAARLAPAARRAVVERREETLDELERRDPVGFARWLAEGPAAGSDPAEYVRGGPATDAEAA